MLNKLFISTRKLKSFEVRSLEGEKYYPFGESQERYYKFTGDELDISTDPFLVNGKQQTVHLIWERAV
ncbi:MAG: hypothetical protein KAX49_09940 [Halanaerobiales bacterium]|nr:hypothetical protein [Halanaerobiales bacterium]